MDSDLDQLWNSLRESKLVSNDIIEKLIASGRSTLPPDASTKDAVEWLISKKAITPYHGKVIAAGRSGPFFYGEYKVQDRLTTGPFSGCFYAAHVGSGYPVLLRFATAEMVADPNRWSRISDRTNAQLDIDHDQLLKYFELVDLDSYKFVVFESRRGSAIGKKIDGGKRVNEKNACHLVRSAALAIQSLHQAGQTHGNVTPDNLFLGADGNCWVHRDPLIEPFDASSDEPAQLAESQTADPADYCAPELASTNASSTAASDIYSLGCVLYRMLCGEVPFAGGDLNSKLDRHANESAEPLTEKEIDSRIADVVASMMSKQPADRPGSMAEVAEMLSPLSGTQKTSELPLPTDKFAKYTTHLNRGAVPTTKATPEKLQSQPNSGDGSATGDAPVNPTAPATPPPIPAAPVPTPDKTTSEQSDSGNDAATTTPAIPTPPIPTNATNPAEVVTPAMSAIPAAGALPPGVSPVAEVPTQPVINVSPQAPTPITPPNLPPGVAAVPFTPAAPVAMDPSQVPATTVALQPGVQPIETAAPTGQTGVSLPVEDATPVSKRRRKRAPNLSTIIGLVVALLLMLPAIYFVMKALDTGTDTIAEKEDEGNGGEVETKDDKDKEGGGETVEPDKNGEETTTAKANGKFAQTLVEDDETKLWETPTVGDPIDLSYVPSGLRMVISMRPAELLKMEDGKLIEKGLGGKFLAARTDFEKKTGVKFEAVEHLLVTFHDNAGKLPRASYVVTLAGSVPKEQLLLRWGNPGPVAIEGKDVDYYTTSDETAFFIPTDAIDDSQGVTRFVMSGKDQIVEMGEYDFAPPTMSTHLRKLLTKTDVTRHFTMLSTPSFLYNDEGEQLFAGEYSKGRDTIKWLVDRDIQAILFSSHLEDDWYVEMMLKGQIDRDPHQLSRDFADRISDGASLVRGHVISMSGNSYWDQVRGYYATWISKMVAETRTGVEDRIMVANLWMPRVSAHNLIVGTELLLASSGPGTSTAGTPEMVTKDPPKLPADLSEVLELKQTVDIPEDDLINAVAEIKQGVLDSTGNKLPFDFDIIMMGNDLRMDGITQNQKVIGFQIEAPLNEVLTALVVKANPDPNSTGPTDELNKLIWVVGKDPKQPDKEVILITTRAAAKRDSIELPAAFVADADE